MGEQGANGWGGLSRRTDPQTPATDLGQRGKGNTREQRRRRDNWASTREETRLDEALHTSQKLTQNAPQTQMRNAKLQAWKRTQEKTEVALGLATVFRYNAKGTSREEKN